MNVNEPAQPPPAPPGAAKGAGLCPECGHAWASHDTMGCSASLMPETATWAGQESWCDCQRSRPESDPTGKKP